METGYSSLASEQFENIHDLFAAIIARGVANQIKRGLHRDYVLREESLLGLRGQIKISETIKQQTLLKGKLVCAYDEFTEDSLHNQILKSVMLLLLHHGNVKNENKKTLRKLIQCFSAITEIAPFTIRWDALKYHRNNASYQMLMSICRLTIMGLLHTNKLGVYQLSTWLPDEDMHRLYEHFVLEYYKKHHADYNPCSMRIEWDLQECSDKTYLPQMQTDITLSKGERRLIIDTKWYAKTMTKHYGKAKFHSDNIYQIYSYVKNSDKKMTGNVAGILLYAKTDETITPDNDFNIGGNNISLNTLDLNQDWSVITERLEQLCGWLTYAGNTSVEETQTNFENKNR
jgi:5-methylcytosine-specific restriction enzyme subunit McrC